MTMIDMLIEMRDQLLWSAEYVHGANHDKPDEGMRDCSSEICVKNKLVLGKVAALLRGELRTDEEVETKPPTE
jgi:hypothetical protein